jgi:hypothetical protein
VESQAARQQPGQGSEHGTVSPVRPPAAGLTPQDRDLVPEDQDLDVLDGSLRASSISQPNTRTMDK